MNWKGGKIKLNCKVCHKEFEVFFGRKNTAKYCSKECQGKTWIGKIPWNLGKKMSKESILKMSIAKKGKPSWNKGLTKSDSRMQYERPTAWRKNDPRISKENQHDWKGGITPIRTKLRHSFQYEEWRKKVFERDLYTCQDCNAIGEYLHADHIKSFSDYPELRFEVSNGRTLCVPCHYLRTWGHIMPKNNKWGHLDYKGERKTWE